MSAPTYQITVTSIRPAWRRNYFKVTYTIKEKALGGETLAQRTVRVWWSPNVLDWVKIPLPMNRIHGPHWSMTKAIHTAIMADIMRLSRVDLSHVASQMTFAANEVE